MSTVPFMMTIGPFKQQTSNGEITIQGNCNLTLNPPDFQKGIVSSIITHIFINITTNTENFFRTYNFGKFMTDKECLSFFLDKIVEFQKTGKLTKV